MKKPTYKKIAATNAQLIGLVEDFLDQHCGHRKSATEYLSNDTASATKLVSAYEVTCFDCADTVRFEVRTAIGIAVPAY